jgi:hypothetical protein
VKLIVVSSGFSHELGSRRNARAVPAIGHEVASCPHSPRVGSWLDSHGVPQIEIRDAVTREASVTLCR